jgi:hypothetical protein
VDSIRAGNVTCHSNVQIDGSPVVIPSHLKEEKRQLEPMIIQFGKFSISTVPLPSGNQENVTEGLRCSGSSRVQSLDHLSQALQDCEVEFSSYSGQADINSPSHSSPNGLDEVSLDPENAPTLVPSVLDDSISPSIPDSTLSAFLDSFDHQSSSLTTAYNRSSPTDPSAIPSSYVSSSTYDHSIPSTFDRSAPQHCPTSTLESLHGSNPYFAPDLRIFPGHHALPHVNDHSTPLSSGVAHPFPGSEAFMGYNPYLYSSPAQYYPPTALVPPLHPFPGFPMYAPAPHPASTHQGYFAPPLEHKTPLRQRQGGILRIDPSSLNSTQDFASLTPTPRRKHHGQRPSYRNRVAANSPAAQQSWGH